MPGQFPGHQENGLIATPYCEEEKIARVARSYGVNVTGAEVHNDALKKVYLCQTYGNDNRLKGSCGGLRSGDVRPLDVAARARVECSAESGRDCRGRSAA